MKYQQKPETRSLVYQYGTVPARVAPVHGEAEAIEQMRLANRLWNVLVSIDRCRTAGYRRIMRDEEQEQIDQLKLRKNELLEEIKKAHKNARAKVATVEFDAEMKRVKAALAMLLENRKATSQARHDARKQELQILNERAKQRIKRARQAAASIGLYWGTYNAVLQGADTGRKLGELQYHRFRAEGTVTAQLQDGPATSECFGAHTFFQIEEKVAGRKWRYARVRIGTKDGQPLWLAIPIVYHREIPTEARVKSVSATRRIVANKVVWSLNLTLNLPPVQPKAAGAMLACDIGWRLLPAGVRVGYWVNDVGQHSEIFVPADDVAQFKTVRDLRSICDCQRNEFLPRLVEWLKDRQLDAEWLQRINFIAQWRSSDRLAGLIRWWSDHRLPDDAEIFTAALAWRKQYLHLANWWRNLEDQLHKRVRERYRIFASEVAHRYSVLILEDFNLKEVVKLNPEAKQTTPQGSDYRHMVSPSTFRQVLINACRQQGVEVRIAPGAYTTATCHACGHLGKWDQAASVLHRCEQCGSLWDQDYNAARNLLASGGSVPTKNQGDTGGILPAPADRSQGGEKLGMESAV